MKTKQGGLYRIQYGSGASRHSVFVTVIEGVIHAAPPFNENWIGKRLTDIVESMRAKYPNTFTVRSWGDENSEASE